MVTVPAVADAGVVTVIASIGGVLLVFLVITSLVLGWINRGTNETFLEWDPGAMAAWREELEDQDAPRMLALHNAQRRAAGRDEVTMYEYLDEMRNR